MRVSLRIGDNKRLTTKQLWCWEGNQEIARDFSTPCHNVTQFRNPGVFSKEKKNSRTGWDFISRVSFLECRVATVVASRVWMQELNDFARGRHEGARPTFTGWRGKRDRS